MENKFHGQRHSVFLECEAKSFLKSKFGEKVQSDSCMYKIALQTFMNFVGILLIVLLYSIFIMETRSVHC